MRHQQQQQNSRFKTYFAGSLVALLIGGTASAQPAATEPVDAPAQLERSERQPTIRTYDKFADPQGDDQDIEATTYYKKPDPSGKNQDLEFVRYREENKANSGENPVNLTVIEEDEDLLDDDDVK